MQMTIKNALQSIWDAVELAKTHRVIARLDERGVLPQIPAVIDDQSADDVAYTEFEVKAAARAYALAARAINDVLDVDPLSGLSDCTPRCAYNATAADLLSAIGGAYAALGDAIDAGRWAGRTGAELLHPEFQLPELPLREILDSVANLKNYG